MSIQDIRQDPQDTSNFYLANIYQALVDPSLPNISSSLPDSPPPFSPPNYAVWVNALWFLSLVISLTCALLATFLQQWARRYLKVTQSRCSPHKRARIRAFFAEGVEKCLFSWAVEVLPTLLHISLFLFFAGLVLFLSNVHITIFKLVFSWVGLCAALYGCITLVPIIRHDSPCYTSLSSLAWYIVIGIAFFVSAVSGLLLYPTVCCHHGADRLFKFARRCHRLLFQGMQKTIEEAALRLPPEIDIRAFMWTFDSLDEDHELERFFSGLPGLRSSKVVDDPLPSLTVWQKSKLRQALTGFMDRTFSSDLLSVSVKERRAMVCAKAFDPEHFHNAFGVFDKILSHYQYRGSLATGIVQVVRGWGTNAGLDAQAIVSMIVARVRPRDESWLALTSNALGAPVALLRHYAADGDSLPLAILIHVVRQQFIHFRKSSWPASEFSFVLEAASKFDGQDTSLELQREFCTLWNQITRKAQGSNSQRMAFRILGRIRNVYLSLHQDTNSAPPRFSASTGDDDDVLWEPSSYPVCDFPDHHPDWKPRILDDSTSTFSAPSLPYDHDNITLKPFHSSTSSNAPLLDDNIAVPPAVFLRPVDQTATESRCIPSTPPNPTRAIQGSMETSPGTKRLPTLGQSGSPPPDVVVAKVTAVDHTDPHNLKAPSPSPAPVLDNMRLPKGPLLPSGCDWI